MNNVNKWYYRNKDRTIKYLLDINDFPKGCVGFVYIIKNTTNNKSYIGRKILKNTNSVKISKRALKEITGSGRKPLKKTIISESNWKDYYGSCKPLQDDVKKQGSDTFLREILKFCYNKKEMGYYEVYYQMMYKVLEHPNDYYNENILGRYFIKDLSGKDD